MSFSDHLTACLLHAVSNVRVENARLKALEVLLWCAYSDAEIRARKTFLHRQLLWIKRRNEAEQNGQQFTEPRPE